MSATVHSLVADDGHDIEVTFWQDAKRLGWSREAKLLAVYLLTSPDRPRSALEYRLTVAMMASAMVWSEAKVIETIDELIDSGFIDYADGEVLRFLGSGKGAL
jgi:hypothetical protein